MKQKKPMPAHAQVISASKGMSAWVFARDVANRMHGGISYKGCSKNLIVKALLKGELGQRVYSANEIIQVIAEAKLEHATEARRREERAKCAEKIAPAPAPKSEYAKLDELPLNLLAYERACIERALRQHPRCEDAAKALNVSRSAMYRMIHRHHLKLIPRKR